jgi:hypothetical protein
LTSLTLDLALDKQFGAPAPTAATGRATAAKE